MKSLKLIALLFLPLSAQAQEVRNIEVYPDVNYIKVYDDLNKAEDGFRKGILSKKNFNEK
jgi:hypothetical protein